MLRLLFSAMIVLFGWQQTVPHEPISLDNADRIEQLEQIGYGTVEELSWSADSNQLAVRTTVGVMLYDNNGVDVSVPSSTIDGLVLDVVFHNGQTIAAIQRVDGTVFVQTSETDEIVELFRGETETYIWLAQLSPDGTRLATVEAEASVGDIVLWNTQTGEETRRFDNAVDFYVTNTIEFLRDGEVLAVQNDRGISFYHLATGVETFRILFRLFSFSVSADNRYIATYKSGVPNRPARLSVRSLETPEILFSIELSEDNIGDFALSSNGEFLAAAYSSGIVRIWSVATATEITSIHITDDRFYPVYISFSPDDRFMAFSSGGADVYIYETETWTEVNVLQGFSYGIRTVDISPDRSTLAFGGYDGLLRVWNIETNTMDAVVEVATYGVDHVTFSPDGTTLFVSVWNGGEVTRWSALDWTLQPSEESINPTRNAIVSPDGSMLAVANYDGIGLYDSTSFTEIRTMTYENINGRRGGSPSTNDIAFSPDGERIVSISGENTVIDGAQENAKISLWDTNTGELLIQVDFPEELHTVAFSPDGSLIATSDVIGNITLWDAQTLTPMATLPGQFRFNYVNALVFSPSSDLLIAADRQGIIHLWDVATHTEIGTLEGHTSVISDLALSPDGTLLASASGDGTVRLWGVR